MIVKPAITKVSGPKTLLDTMQAVYTEKLVLNNLWETLTHAVGFNAKYKKQKINMEPSKAVLHVPVEKYTESQIVVELVQRNVPDSLQIKAIPNEVELKFLLPLSKMASLPSAKFVAFIDYNQINDDYVSKLEVKIAEQPDFVTITNISPNKVEYILKRK